MKSLILYFLCASLCAAATKVGGSGVTKVGGSGVTKVSAAASQYLIEDNLEYLDASAATTGGWVQAGTPTWAYATAPAPLQGSYSLQINASADAATHSFTAQSDVWAYYLFSTSNAANTSMRVYFLDAADAAQAEASANSATYWRANSGGGTNANSTVGDVVTDTKYHIWLHYVKGTGANAILEIYASTDGIKGTVKANRTSGTSTGDAAKIRLNLSTSTLCIFDRVIVSSTEIGDNP